MGAEFRGTFQSSWDRDACACEAGPEDHVDLMSDSLPGGAEKGPGSVCGSVGHTGCSLIHPVRELGICGVWDSPGSIWGA